MQLLHALVVAQLAGQLRQQHHVVGREISVVADAEQEDQIVGSSS